MKGKSRVPKEKKIELTREDARRLAEWCVLFTDADVTSLTICETYCAIKTLSMRWRHIELQEDSEIVTLRKYVDYLFHHTAFMITGAIPPSMCDDEYGIITKKTTGTTAKKSIPKEVSETFIAYASGAFTFMWRSLDMHSEMRVRCVRRDVDDITTKARIAGLEAWVESFAAETSSKKKLKDEIAISIAEMCIRPGEEEMYTFLEHTDMKNTLATDILMKVRTESQYSYYNIRLKEYDIHGITRTMTPSKRDIIARKVVDMNFRQEHRVSWTEIAYVDESEYHNRKIRNVTKNITTPIVLKVMGNYYVIVNGNAIGVCASFTSAFLLWMEIIENEPYNMTLKLPGRNLKLHEFFSIYDKWQEKGLALLHGNLTEQEKMKRMESEESESNIEDMEESDMVNDNEGEYIPLYLNKN